MKTRTKLIMFFLIIIGFVVYILIWYFRGRTQTTDIIIEEEPAQTQETEAVSDFTRTGEDVYFMGQNLSNVTEDPEALKSYLEEVQNDPELLDEINTIGGTEYTLENLLTNPSIIEGYQYQEYFTPDGAFVAQVCRPDTNTCGDLKVEMSDGGVDRIYTPDDIPVEIVYSECSDVYCFVLDETDNAWEINF